MLLAIAHKTFKRVLRSISLGDAAIMIENRASCSFGLARSQPHD